MASPLVGRMSADFSDFVTAVSKAEISLKGLETGSAKVESALSKMANSLSGNKIIGDATLMTRAVEQAGGASTLTAREMAKVNSTVNEAIAKYKALGGQAPKAMQDLANATKNTDAAGQSWSSMLGKARGLLASLGIGLSVAAVVSFGKALADSAGALVDLEAKTGNSLDQLQRWAFVGSQAGVSTEQFADAAFKLGVKLAGGSGSVRDAVEKLGLSYDKLRTQSPDEQFNEIVRALEAMVDPQERNRLGVELFGKTFATIAPAVAKGYTEIATQAAVSSDAQIKAIDNASDAWDRFLAKTKTKLTSWVGNQVIATEQLNKLNDAQLRQYRALIAVGDVAGSTKFLMDLAKQVDIVLPKQKDLTTHTTDYAAQLVKVKGEVAQLTTSQIAGISAAERLGKSTEEISNAYGISEGALRLLKEQTTKHAQETTKSATAITKVKEEVEKLLPSQHSWALGIGQLNDRVPDLSAHVLEMRDAFEELREWIAPLASVDLPALNKELLLLPNVLPGGTQAIQDATGAIDESTNATNDWGGALHSLAGTFTQMAQVGGESFSEANEKIGMSITLANSLVNAISKVTAAGATAGQKLQGAADIAGVIFTVSMAFIQASRDAEELAEKTRILTRFQKSWNTEIALSDELYRQLFAPAGRQTFFLIQLLGELGGVTALTAEQTKKFGDVLRADLHLIASGSGDAVKAQKELNDVLVQMGNAAVESGGLVSQVYIDMVKAAQAAGVELAGVDELILTQLGGAAEGINELMTGLSKGLGDSFIVTAEQGAGLAAATAATFAEMIERGMSYKEALDKLKPSIDILTETLKKSGVDGGSAFDFLTEMARIAGDEFMGPLSDAITGANKALKGLHNSGILNQTMFTGLEQSAMQAYQKIIDGGGDGNAALMMMQPTLQTLWAMQRDFGYIVDDATQALLDEAEATGKVGDKHRPVAEQMLLATQAIEKAVTALARALGADLPASAESGADRVSKALKGIQGPPPIDAPWAHWGSPPELVDVPGAATGGYVTDRGIQHFANGGRVLNFRPRGSDTVPAMLTPGEMVLTPGQQRQAFGRGGGDSTAILAEFRAMRADQARRDARLNEAIAKAVKNEMQKVGGRRR